MDGFLVVGVGNPLRGDDVAGLLLGRAVAQRTGNPYLECEDVPENYLAEMHQSPAQTLLMTDAVNMGAAAGEIRLLEMAQLADAGSSTHKGSLRLLGELLSREYAKDVLVLGIQPCSLEWGAGLTEVVAEAIRRFAASLSHEGCE